MTGSLAGRTIVVTGGSDGIGRAAARALLALGADVVLVGRNEAKTAAAAAALMSEAGRRAVTWEIADLERLDAMHDLAQRLRDRLPRIHALVNNAGALFLDRRLTADGLERTFALNHLAYVVLTVRLLDRLVAAAAPGAPARVIIVSSRAHENARLDLDDLQLAHGYGGWRAYANSKLCNLLVARALARRLDPTRVVVQAMHPGVVRTRFATNNGGRGRLLRRLMDLVSVTPEQGADTIAWLAESPEGARDSGTYWVRRRPVQPSRAARDDALAERLWRVSGDLAGLDLDGAIAESGAAPVAFRPAAP